MIRSALSGESELFIDCDMSQPRLIESRGAQIGAISRRSPDRDTANEDSAAVIETGSNSLVLIVADGMGGRQNGEDASAIAVNELATSLRNVEKDDDLRPAIIDAIENANRRVLDCGLGAGTTATIAELTGDGMRVYNVGDSQAILFGQRGLLKWISTAHSPVGYAVESGYMDVDEAMMHDERHVISNFIGDEDMHIEIGPTRRLSQRDTLVIASDGLFDNLHHEEIVNLGRLGPVEQRVSALADLASTRMQATTPAEGEPSKPDDLTLLLYTPA